jgi:hypothetical protein
VQSIEFLYAASFPDSAHCLFIIFQKAGDRETIVFYQSGEDFGMPETIARRGCEKAEFYFRRRKKVQ